MGLENGPTHTRTSSQRMVWNENLKPVLIQWPFYAPDMMKTPCVPLVMFETSFYLMTCFARNKRMDLGTFSSDNYELSLRINQWDF